MEKIMVVGAGTMGIDIAHVFAVGGKQVIVRDIEQGIVDQARSKLERQLEKLVNKGKIPGEEKAGRLQRIGFTTDLGSAGDADLVIEAVVENAEVKKNLFHALDSICKPETVFASNTSAISITELANVTGRSGRFIGMHFFNPATVMKLVEIIRGMSTDDETVAAVVALCLEMGKMPVEVKETAGFVVNRLLIPMINDAISLLERGIADTVAIDQAMKLGANHPMGPLALADFIGLDVCLAIMETLHKETGDSKYRPAELLRKMVRGGLLGKKCGRGFYSYE